jgi:hypothetical protein
MQLEHSDSTVTRIPKPCVAGSNPAGGTTTHQAKPAWTSTNTSQFRSCVLPPSAAVRPRLPPFAKPLRNGITTLEESRFVSSHARQPPMILHAGRRVASRRPGVSPTTRRPGGTIPSTRRPSLPGVPPGRRVVALGEVGGMPHPHHPTDRAWRWRRPSWRPARPARACFVWTGVASLL